MKYPEIHHLAMDLGMPMHFVEYCTSTNDVLAEKLQQGWKGVVIADEQSAGHGRLNRRWDSQKAQNLLFSMPLQVAAPLQQIPRIPLLIAAEIADELDVLVKWPNDIIDKEKKKMGGIYSQIHQIGPPHTLIVGIGLNINQREFAHLPNATSLANIMGHPCDRWGVLQQILKRIQVLDLFRDFELWQSKHGYHGEKVEIGSLTGVVSGIREDGALLLGEQAVLTGDVTLID